MNPIQILTIRFNLNKPADRAAWERLRNMDRKRYKSYSQAVIIAVNDHFERQEYPDDTPFFGSDEKDNRFFYRVREATKAAVSDSYADGVLGLARFFQAMWPHNAGVSADQSSNTAEESLEDAMAFMDGL